MGLAGGFAVVVSVGVLTVVVVVAPAVVGLLVAALVAAGAVEPGVVVPPDAGVVEVAGAAGNVVSGVGTGGSGLVITLAIISFRPASELL